MIVLKIIEVEGRSRASSDSAVHEAVTEAKKVVAQPKGADVLSVGLFGPDLEEWRARVRVAYVVEPRYS
jgi:flavin-binding protein dodecin